MSAMPFEDFETAYETLATAIDQAGPAREALFLTRLALVLGHELGDIPRKLARREMRPGPRRPAHPDFSPTSSA